VASDPSIWKDHPDFTRYTSEGFTIYFEHLINTNYPFIIIDKNSNKIIGATSYYEHNPQQKSIAIGYTLLAMSHRGGKFNQSMKNLMIHYAFQYVNQIIFHVRSTNFRSQAALHKIGARKTKEYPLPSDPNSIQYVYVIDKKEYLTSSPLH